MTDFQNQTLVALTPAEMLPAQQALETWCDQKIAALRVELADLETNLELTTEHGWKHTSVAATLNRTTKRITYYDKMKQAVAAGYLMVPNFPIDVFAVRVKRAKQPVAVKSYGGFTADPQLLPAGEGRYVDERLLQRDETHTETVDGKERLVRRFVSDDYDDVDFPVALVKPTVLHATHKAMALRIFDEMGTVQNSAGKDPIVVGRLIDPRKRGRMATFFVAWWLDTNTL